MYSRLSMIGNTHNSQSPYFQVGHLVVGCQEVCQGVCLEGCLEVLELEDPLPLVVDLDPPLRKWTNLLILVLVFGNKNICNWYFSLV